MMKLLRVSFAEAITQKKPSGGTFYQLYQRKKQSAIKNILTVDRTYVNLKVALLWRCAPCVQCNYKGSEVNCPWKKARCGLLKQEKA